MIIATTVKSDGLEGTANSVSPEPTEEGLKICPVCEFIEVTSNTDSVLVGGLGNVSAGVVESAQASGGDSSGAARRDSSKGTRANELVSDLDVAVKRLDVRLQPTGSLHASHSAKVGSGGNSTDVFEEDGGKAV